MSRDWRIYIDDIVAHDYFGIDNDILWDIIRNKVPHLIKAIGGYLRKK
jgi:uncharacterized protein with HEPN domain